MKKGSLVFFCILLVGLTQFCFAVKEDPRNIANGLEIPSKHYADQPYVVQADDGAWLCVITTADGVEGSLGQHVVSMRSTDRGQTWSEPVDIEPADGPQASYVVPLKVPSGRIYCFYNYNTDRVAEVKREDGGVYNRVDCLGDYVFKYSDDHGRSWSSQRYPIPVRAFECDRNNVYGGELKFFWNVGRPTILSNAAICVLHKVGAYGKGFYAQSEGAFLRSTNILTERDPEKITFETLPEGDIGLRTPPGGGRVSEEQSVAVLSDGSLFCVYRTTDGWPACSYSRDGARTWTPPAYMSYAPGGRRVKHPRAANFVWRCSNGKFLYWFHNHGGHFISEFPGEWDAYRGRNPAWLMAGREIDTPQGRIIEWSQPEILLYDDDPYIRISYPDLIEQNGSFYITETQKATARSHRIPDSLLAGLFGQWDASVISTKGLILNVGETSPVPDRVAMPKLPLFNRRDRSIERQPTLDLRAGISLDLWLQIDSFEPGLPLLDSRDDSGKGIFVASGEDGSLRITLSDGRTECSWGSDRNLFNDGGLHHVVITADGGPKIITFIVDGVLCDGQEQRQFGWGRYSPNLRTPDGADYIQIEPVVRSLKIYSRALSTSEAVGNFHAGLGK